MRSSALRTILDQRAAEEIHEAAVVREGLRFERRRATARRLGGLFGRSWNAMHVGDEAAQGAARAGRHEFSGLHLHMMARARVARAALANAD